MMNASALLADDTALERFHPVVRAWFRSTFPQPTGAQAAAWPAIAGGRNTLLLAPTGSGKTLAAFLVAIDRLMFTQPPSEPAPPPAATRGPRRNRATTNEAGVRVLYISPLKALGVDIERNLRAPLAGIRQAALRDGVTFHSPSVRIRTGDTPADERRQLVKDPPEILITTPESLYLLLTSQARGMLTNVDTVIVDEIHSLVSTKRGVHLFLSLERLHDLRVRAGHTGDFQRIGLSATQRPLDEVARLLAGADEVSGDQWRARPVEIVDASYRKAIEVRIEVPVEDMTRPVAEVDISELELGHAAGATPRPSIWPAIHPRLIELIRAHRTTIIFTNSRRLAERLATAINELAGEQLALAHHGSIARETRQSIEDRLKRGLLPAIVATSTLELGIDMGTVDLVVQIEAPPSIASGIQRIGRAGHHVGGSSLGIVFPKFRGDLLACSAASQRMQRGEVESSRYPRNTLDVLAQQIVATVALEPRTVDELYSLVRRAAPFADLPRASFDGVLDLLSGRYPSDQFAELRPRVNWDRVTGTVSARKGAQRIAILNGGTIPDRGLYGVFLADGGDGGGTRVGELDEEMVYETQVGDVFLLGATSWRVTEITHDRVLVVPAPGEPGRMPFWHGDGPGRPLEFGRGIGELTRHLTRLKSDEAVRQLTDQHGLDPRAANNLIGYLQDQSAATGEPPSDRTIVVESFVDEVGDWRVVILSPFGSRVHAPWATAVAGRLRQQLGSDVDMIWSDDGLMFRLPESDAPPGEEQLFPRADEIEELVVRELSSTAMFAARFRENAARALLLPRRRATGRTPLWVQRRRSADLLAVASQFPSFPILLETYRECLRDVFDLSGLQQILRDVETRAIRVRLVESRKPSPFASSLMFSYTANFLYEGDAPLAERRAHTLSLDHAQLRELLGDAELRELFDAEVVAELGLSLQRLDGRHPIRDADDLHQMLLWLGDLTWAELQARRAEDVAEAELARWLDELLAARRIVLASMAGEQRFAAAEDAARLRDALGVAPPPGLPEAFLEAVADPLGDLVSRYARTHTPFHVEDVARRFGLGTAVVRRTLEQLAAADRVMEGEFVPGGRGREWCDAEVLRTLKRRSLAALRRQIEPVARVALARFLPHWHGVTEPRAGLDALLDVVEQLQGMALPASALERWILPARVAGYQPSDLDTLCAEGEVIWCGVQSVGGSDGRVALYLADAWHALADEPSAVEHELAGQVREVLARRGASFFQDLVSELGGFANDVLEALWDLVWAGEVTNDTLAPLRSLLRSRGKSRATRSGRRAFRSRRAQTLPGAEGRWTLLRPGGAAGPSPTERQTARARQLLRRYGIVTRMVVASEGLAGGFAGLYPVLKAMEEAGKVRRGYFVEGLGGAQFAVPGAEDRLRERPPESVARRVWVLAATDPANPYGASLAWPARRDDLRPQRAAGARVILCDGWLLATIGRSGEQLLTFPPAEEAEMHDWQTLIVQALAQMSEEEPVYLTQIDGQPTSHSPWAPRLVAAGFSPSSQGYLLRRSSAS